MKSCACKPCSAGLSDGLSDACRDLTPHPQYAAFYKWLQQDYKADAVVHFGMHGTVEWLPGAPLGKQHVTSHAHTSSNNNNDNDNNDDNISRNAFRFMMI